MSTVKDPPQETPTDKKPSGIVLQNRFRLLPDKRLPDLDTPGVQAMEVEDIKGESKTALYAQAGDYRFLGHPRQAELLLAAGLSHLPRIYGYDYVRWSDGTQRFVIICERPMGAPVIQNLGDKITPFTEDQVRELVVKPLVPILKFMAENDLTHRAIRPQNFYYATKGKKHLVLGHGLIGPPAYGQPPLIEDINSAMASPAGRGEGRQSDDLFALGMTCLFFLLGQHPLRGKKDQEVLLERINKGTYAAMASGYNFSVATQDLLKGLLNDFEPHRWQIQDLEQWLHNAYRPPKQPKSPERATRPYEFAEQEHYTLKGLALAFNRYPADASAILTQHDFHKWLERSFSDRTAYKKINDLLEYQTAMGREPSFRPNELAQVCIAMDPTAPPRYRDLAVFPDGLANMIVVHGGDPQNMQNLTALIDKKILQEWLNQNSTAAEEIYMKFPKMLDINSYLSSGSPGYGIERTMYELDEDIPCLSPLLKGYYVKELDDLMSALESLAPHINPSQQPMDNHIASWCAAHCGLVTDGMLHDLSNRGAKRDVAILRILSSVQEDTKREHMPNLTAWLGTQMEAAISTYHSNTRRQRLRATLERELKNKSLKSLANLMDNTQERRLDDQQFRTARRYHLALSQRLEQLRNNKPHRGDMSRALGGQIAASLSAVLSVVIVSLYIWMSLFRG